MLQEIITYMIIGGAVTIAISKTIKQFRKKKPQKVDYKKATISAKDNCTECAAECMLRDAPKRIVESGQAVCTSKKNLN